MAADLTSESPRGRWPAFVTILFAPVETMQRILAKERRGVVPLVALALVSVMLNDRGSQPIPAMVQHALSAKVVAIVVAVFVASVLVCAALFALFSGIAWAAGKYIFHGTGTWRDVRAAMAWGLAPLVWAILWRLPAAIWAPHQVTISTLMKADMNVLANHFLLVILALALETVMIVGTFVISAFTLAVAHRLEPAEGALTLLTTVATPVVVVIAAVLSMH